MHGTERTRSSNVPLENRSLVYPASRDPLIFFFLSIRALEILDNHIETCLPNVFCMNIMRRPLTRSYANR